MLSVLRLAAVENPWWGYPSVIDVHAPLRCVAAVSSGRGVGPLDADVVCDALGFWTSLREGFSTYSRPLGHQCMVDLPLWRALVDSC